MCHPHRSTAGNDTFPEDGVKFFSSNHVLPESLGLWEFLGRILNILAIISKYHNICFLLLGILGFC